VAAAAWLAAALRAGHLAWRRTPLDLPVLLLLALVAVQLLLGNRALVAWALAPGRPVADLVADFPAPFLTVGTVAPRQTAAAALVFVGYAAVYFLVVQTVGTRRQVGRLVRTLIVVGGLMAFLGLLDYLTGETWLLRWREHPFAARLSGTFVNPDHFAAWLAMLIALGLGWMASRAPEPRGGPSLAQLLSVRELRERVTRRYLPLLGIAVMVLALVFTLSRGGLVNLVTALLVLVALLTVARRARRSLVLTGVLVIAVLAYGGWIGFGPLLARLSSASEGTAYRFAQYVASLPLFREFPVLGVGLGAYREIYFRHQPIAHEPDRLYFPYAHNDLLQLALELGPLGALLCLFLAWRIAADLGGVHLLGRGRCPVDGGEGAEAVRHDRYSVGIAIGALAGVAGLVAHSALDFSARIPAVGILGAVLLGLATVALHTRLGAGHEQVLSGTVTLSVAGPARRLSVALLAILALAGWTWTWVHGARVRAAEAAMLDAPPAEYGPRAEAVLALDRRNPRALLGRARTQQGAAVQAWQSPPAPGIDRASVARERLAEARAALRLALTVTPTDPWLHLDLAWVEATEAVVRERAGPEGMAEALTHGARAAALGRDSALFYAGLARLAYSVPELGLRAAREAVRRRPALLGEMVDLYFPLGLTAAEWLEVVPASAVDRLALALALEARGARVESVAVQRAAVTVASAPEAAVYRWALAEALGRAGADAGAIEALRPAVKADPDNPELQRALGAALARRDDPAALEHLRAALDAMDRRPAAAERRPFVTGDPRLVELLHELAPDLDRTVRYRRALAAYLTRRRLWDQAAPEWEALARDNPRDAEARFGLGVAREGLGASAEGLEDVRAAVELAPGEVRYRRHLAQRLWHSEQYFQAINEWRILAEQRPRDVDSRLALARAWEKVGQPADAYRQYREVLALDPAQAEATRAIARLEGRR
jgi:tetratricopeptide (TPR) repeat protein